MRYFTAGESHGQELTAIVEGAPAGLRISEEQINTDLARRQSGYGRGGRQKIEHDTVRVTSGIRFGRTIGSPIAMVVRNRDWENWEKRMAPFGEAPQDLIRVLKTDTDDCRNILERASARETAARVAASGIPREFLAELGVEILSYVTSIGEASMKEDDPIAQAAQYAPLDIELSEVRCPDSGATRAMKREVDKAIENRSRRSWARRCCPSPRSRASSSGWASTPRACPAPRCTTRSCSTPRPASRAPATTPAGWRAA